MRADLKPEEVEEEEGEEEEEEDHVSVRNTK